MPRSPFPRPWIKFSPHLKKSIFSSFCVTATTTQKNPKKPAKTNFFKMAQWIDSKLIANCFYDIRAYKLIFWGRTTNYYYDFFRVHFCAYPEHLRIVGSSIFSSAVDGLSPINKTNFFCLSQIRESEYLYLRQLEKFAVLLITDIYPNI